MTDVADKLDELVSAYHCTKRKRTVLRRARHELGDAYHLPLERLYR